MPRELYHGIRNNNMLSAMVIVAEHGRQAGARVTQASFEDIPGLSVDATLAKDLIPLASSLYQNMEANNSIHARVRCTLRRERTVAPANKRPLAVADVQNQSLPRTPPRDQGCIRLPSGPFQSPLLRCATTDTPFERPYPHTTFTRDRSSVRPISSVSSPVPFIGIPSRSRRRATHRRPVETVPKST